jgi:hypothetical protein
MASEADSSKFVHSATQETQDSIETRTRGRSAHSTWVHSRMAREEDRENPEERYCIHCKENPIYSTKVTTNLWNHLKSNHSIIVVRTLGQVQAAIINQLEQLYLRAESSSQTNDIDIKVFQKHLNQDVINEALVSLIVVRNLPFRIVCWPEFHTFCQVLNLESFEYIIIAHSQVSKKIEQSWNTHKDVVRRKLQSAISRIYISLDIWTSPNRLLLLGIITHIVDY